jgi:hypothetical protein
MKDRQMIYGLKHTINLGDRGGSPKESFPYVYALMDNDTFMGAPGRKALRKLLGTQHEKSDKSIPGMRGFDVWRYALDGDTVRPAPEDVDVTGMVSVYILGPTAKKFLTVEGDKDITGPQAATILRWVFEAHGLDLPA